MEDNKTTVEDVKVEVTGEVDVKSTEETVEMISKTEAQKMVNSALAKKLPPKEEMDAFKNWKESQKTEAEKQAEIQKQLILNETEKTNLKNENILLKKGVNSDDIDYVLFKVGKMEGEFETNLENYLKENEKFIKKEEVKTTGVQVNKGNSNKESGVTAILRQRHPELFN